MSLLNKQAVREHIRHRFESQRPHLGITRVSERAICDIEAFLKIKINESIQACPSVGKTYMEFP